MALALHEMLQALFGITSHHVENPLVTAVGTSATKILPGNPQRVSFVVFNMGSTTVYIAPSNLVSSSHGIVLAPNGGNVVMQWDKDFELVSQEWFGVSSAACNIYLLENLIQ